MFVSDLEINELHKFSMLEELSADLRSDEWIEDTKRININFLYKCSRLKLSDRSSSYSGELKDYFSS